MATSNLSTKCFTCKEETTTYPCPGCSNHFCLTDLIKHQEELKLQFHEIEHQRNEFVQMINDQQKTIPNNHPAIIQINLWEQKSIEKIKQTAQEQRQIVQQSIHGYLPQIQTQFNDFTQQIQQINKKKDFNEKVLEKLQIQLKEIQQQINQPTNIQINEDSSSTFIRKLSIQILHSQHQTKIYHRHQLKSNIKWKPNAQTIAGGNGQGNQLNQLNCPFGIYVDHQQQHIYIADHCNHRIVKWKLGENNGEIVAGGNGQGNRIDQLNCPIDVIVDENNKSLIICDQGNRRVLRWSLENPNGDKEILIQNILGWGLMMNENGDLFVSDYEENAVKRWRKDGIEKGNEGIIVAGGNGPGNKLNQLNCPTYIFIDREETIYVSDSGNARVMKWLRGANEGIIVAGGQEKGNSLNQLNVPYGLLVNEIGDVYVVDSNSHRIMCWSVESKEGRVVVGGNGSGQGSTQLNYPRGLSFDVENNLYVADRLNYPRDLSFDVENNLYVADRLNNRIQRFNVDNKD